MHRLPGSCRPAGPPSGRPGNDAGLLFQVRIDGTLWLWQRIRRGLSSQAGGALPASGRLRLRLVKGAGDRTVMLALIVIVCLTAIGAVGTNANSKFESVRDALT